MCIPELINHKVKLTNGQIGILKLSVICFGIALGCYFADFFRPYLLPVIVICVAAGVWITIIWMKAMKE